MKVFFPKRKAETKILFKQIVLADCKCKLIYKILNVIQYFEKWNNRLKIILKNPLFVYKSSTRTWITIACPPLKLLSYQYATSVVYIKWKKSVVACIWALLDKGGNNSWYSLRICFCRLAKWNVKQVECVTDSSIQHALYETWAWGQMDVYCFVHYVKKNAKTVKYLHFNCT